MYGEQYGEYAFHINTLRDKLPNEARSTEFGINSDVTRLSEMIAHCNHYNPWILRKLLTL